MALKLLLLVFVALRAQDIPTAVCVIQPDGAIYIGNPCVSPVSKVALKLRKSARIYRDYAISLIGFTTRFVFLALLPCVIFGWLAALYEVSFAMALLWGSVTCFPGVWFSVCFIMDAYDVMHMM